MKNFINYYYSFNIHDIYYNDNKYIFYNDKSKYMLKTFYGTDTRTLLEINKQLQQQKSYYFKLILNNENKPVTVIEGKPYILLLISNIPNEKLTIFDIRNDMYINNYEQIATLDHSNWISLWEAKIDYYENTFTSKKDALKAISPVFNYYIGLAENAALYIKKTLREVKKEATDVLTISHKRLNVNYSLYDYYDISNVIIDYSSRDISEYIKSMFMDEKMDIDFVLEYMGKKIKTKFAAQTIIARLLFPSFFFDILERVLNEGVEEKELFKLEIKIGEYHKLLNEIILYFQNKYQIKEILWIKKEM